MNQDNTAKIPSEIIGLLSDFFPTEYTHDGIDGIFLSAGAPDADVSGSKPTKVREWLRLINRHSARPTQVLGLIIEEVMEYDPLNDFQHNEDRAACLKEIQQTINRVLSKNNLQYIQGGNVLVAGHIPSIDLQKSVKEKGLEAVGIEIQRALKHVEDDPISAVHSAGNVLEAVFKSYLEYHSIQHNAETEAFATLWQKTAAHMNLNPKNHEDKNLKKVASGLFNIADGIMHLRNKKSAAHGKSEQQFKRMNIKPRHARLVVNSAHTLSAYILELT